jgi:hypothetical protein
VCHRAWPWLLAVLHTFQARLRKGPLDLVLMDVEGRHIGLWLTEDGRAALLPGKMQTQGRGSKMGSGLSCFLPGTFSGPEIYSFWEEIFMSGPGPRISSRLPLPGTFLPRRLSPGPGLLHILCLNRCSVPVHMEFRFL